ncbi:MAG: chemotaxis protein CheW [Mariprofundaceae bacterium]
MNDKIQIPDEEGLPVGKEVELSAEALLDIEQEEMLLIILSGKEFLIRVKEVTEIIRPVDMTPVPMAPDHLLGMANIRGQIVCIINPGKVSNLPESRLEQTEKTRFLILRHPRMHVGIWVDEVRSLHRVRAEDVPEQTGDAEKSHVRGQLGIDGQSYDVLNSEALLL